PRPPQSRRTGTDRRPARTAADAPSEPPFVDTDLQPVRATPPPARPAGRPGPTADGTGTSRRGDETPPAHKAGTTCSCRQVVLRLFSKRRSAGPESEPRPG